MLTIRLPCSLIAALLFVGSAPASAEYNRLLPFWAQPYPTGYTRTEAPAGDFGRRCVVVRRVRTRHGERTVRENRCGPVLHARD